MELSGQEGSIVTSQEQFSQNGGWLNCYTLQGIHPKKKLTIRFTEPAKIIKLNAV